MSADLEHGSGLGDQKPHPPSNPVNSTVNVSASSTGNVKPFTTRAHRVRAMVVYIGAFLLWTEFIGLPNDPIGVFLWIWAAGIAWNIDAPWSYHRRFPADWWPVLAGLTVYYFSRALADNLGIPVHVTMPIDFDIWLSELFGFGSELPTAQMQQAWCATPCTTETPTHWYDLAFSLTYATHFFLGLTIAAVLWVRNRESWKRWMRRYLGLNFAALAIYFVYPMAPPWMASDDGFTTEVHRITSRGFSSIGLERANIVLQGVGNQVAAMPSLHAGVTFLIAFYGVQRLRSKWRFVLLLYPLAMSTALVYFAEHYVIDILAGGLVAALVMMGCSLWERRHPAPESAQEAASTT